MLTSCEVLREYMKYLYSCTLFSFFCIIERKDSSLQAEISKEIKKRKGKELPR